jgi:hypothetical protein
LPATAACKLQLEATIAPFPNTLPSRHGLAVMEGHAASLTRQLVGTSAAAVHLRAASAPENTNIM